MTSEPEVLFEEKGNIGLITLNRPKALNALTLGMIRKMDPKMREWATNDAIKAVVVRGSGEKAFCAGGDVRAVWTAGQEGGNLTKEFFYEEYVLNHLIYNYPKPYVTLLDGITMGGGVGIAVLGSHRVVSEKTLFAMPETAIGLFPDVGGSWFLNKCPGEVGMFLALTGARLKASDTIAANIATNFVPSANIEALETALADANYDNGDAVAIVDMVLAPFEEDAPDSNLEINFPIIDECFGKNSVEEIYTALTANDSEFAQGALADLNKKSPTSMKISLKQLRDGKTMSFNDCMIMEYRMSQACMAGVDFYEGIRAVLVDKDQNPTWSPATLEDVTDELVNKHFESLGASDLTFD